MSKKTREVPLCDCLQSCCLQKNNLRGGKPLQISCDAVLDQPPCSKLRRKLVLHGPPFWVLACMTSMGKKLLRSRKVLAVSEAHFLDNTETSAHFSAVSIDLLIGSPSLRSLLFLLVFNDVRMRLARPLTHVIGGFVFPLYDWFKKNLAVSDKKEAKCLRFRNKILM